MFTIFLFSFCVPKSKAFDNKICSFIHFLFQTNFRNETPLILAVRMNSARLVRQLLAAGADHSIPTADGSLPVMLSVNSGHLVVREFINAKVPLNTVNSHGESAVTLAIRNRKCVNAPIYASYTNNLLIEGR